MLLFLMASGLTVIFSMLGVLNFAHASFYMLGAFFGFQIARWFGFWPALLIAPLLAGAIGAEPRSFAYGRFCCFSACSSASRPFASASSRVSRENHCRILLRARELFASDIQSRDGPRPCFAVSISTKSPF